MTSLTFYSALSNMLQCNEIRINILYNFLTCTGLTDEAGWISAAFTDSNHDVDYVGQCHILSNFPDDYMD